jgi:hypothetical protein
MRKKTIKMRYTGPVPIRIPGITGHINHNDEISVPIDIANNLDRDFFFEINETPSKKETPKPQKNKGKKEVENE